MKINQIKSYSRIASLNPNKRIENKEKKEGYVDINISSEGRDALNNSYSLEKIMKIHESMKDKLPSKEDSNYYWNARKNNVKLDTYLYQKDKAEALEFVGKVQNILLKTSMGMELTPEERKMVSEDPLLKQEIEKRKGAIIKLL